MRIVISAASILLLAWCGLAFAESGRRDAPPPEDIHAVETSSSSIARSTLLERYPDEIQRRLAAMMPVADAATPPALNRGSNGRMCLAGGVMRAGDTDPCPRGREIATLSACTRADDCPAVEAWRELMGPPRVEVASPASAETPESESDGGSDAGDGERR